MKRIMYEESSKQFEYGASFEFDYRKDNTQNCTQFDLLFRHQDDFKKNLLKIFSGKIINFKQLYEMHSVNKPFIEEDYKKIIKQLFLEQKLIYIIQKQKNTYINYLLQTTFNLYLGNKMHKTRIAWTEKTWNPITGCNKISSGCENCYAEIMAKRLHAMGIKKYANSFKVTLHESALFEPFNCREPSMIFVCSMADIFHAEVPYFFIDSIFDVIEKTPMHTYQILTKRPAIMADYFKNRQIPKNAWLGVTVEARSEIYRIDYLRNLNATVRFISAEPLLTDLTDVDLTNINWVVVAGESGARGRPMKEEWVLSLYEQCKKSNIAFFFKQWGMWGHDGIRRSKKENGDLLLGVKVQQMPSY